MVFTTEKPAVKFDFDSVAEGSEGFSFGMGKVGRYTHGYNQPSSVDDIDGMVKNQSKASTMTEQEQSISAHQTTTSNIRFSQACRGFVNRNSTDSDSQPAKYPRFESCPQTKSARLHFENPSIANETNESRPTCQMKLFRGSDRSLFHPPSFAYDSQIKEINAAARSFETAIRVVESDSKKMKYRLKKDDMDEKFENHAFQLKSLQERFYCSETKLHFVELKCKDLESTSEHHASQLKSLQERAYCSETKLYSVELKCKEQEAKLASLLEIVDIKIGSKSGNQPGVAKCVDVEGTIDTDMKADSSEREAASIPARKCLEKLKKKNLQDLCAENNVVFVDKDTRAILISKLLALE